MAQKIELLVSRVKIESYKGYLRGLYEVCNGTYYHLCIVRIFTASFDFFQTLEVMMLSLSPSLSRSVVSEG